jgi:hypothetical protein
MRIQAPGMARFSAEPNPVPQPKPTPPPGKSGDSFTRRGFIGTSLLTLVGLGAASQSADARLWGRLGTPPLPIRRPAPHGLQSGWAPNVRSLCCAGQEWSVPVQGVYMPELTRELRARKVSGLQEAHERVERTGYTNSTRTVRYFPTSTPTAPLRTFLKRDNKDEERFAVLLGQTMDIDYDNMCELEIEAHEAFNEAERVDMDLLENHLKSELNVVPDRNHLERIRRYPAATAANVMEAVTWLAQKRDQIHRENPHKKVGLFVYYGGHGTASTPYHKFEGGSEGRLCGPNLQERELKQMVNGILGRDPRTQKRPHQRRSNVLLMFDMCHAGAMSVGHQDQVASRNI